jgi:NodT family efflux transporter outer membrane factor (OMF) lipoprotein
MADQFLEGSGEGGELAEWWNQFGDAVLSEIVQEALTGNLDLRLQLEKIEEVRARYKLRGSDLWPEIDLTGTFQREQISENIFLAPFEGPRIQDFFSLGFDASWELDLFGRLRRLKNAAYAQWEAAGEGLRDVQVSVVGEIGRTYGLYRGAEAQAKVTYESIEGLKRLLFLKEVLLEAGLAEAQEVELVQARLMRLSATLPLLEQQKGESLLHLAILTGRQPESIPESWKGEGSLVKSSGRIPVGLPSDLLRRRPDIRRAERELAAQTELVGAAVAGLFPTFSLTGGLSFQSDEADDLFEGKSFAWNFGPSLSWPAIDFGRVRNRVDIEKARQKQALTGYEQTVLLALEEVEKNLLAYGKQAIRVEELGREVASLSDRAQLAADLTQAGLASEIGLLEAKLLELERELDRVRGEERLTLHLMALYKSLGGQWPCSATP